MAATNAVRWLDRSGERITGKLELRPHAVFLQGSDGMSRVAVVVPLKPGARARAERLLAHGPPFDPQTAGLERHQVFVTDIEAIFIFDAPEPDVVDRLLAEAHDWGAATAWSELMAAPPRPARVAYSWRRTEPDESLSYAPTPGPGDSDGGDIFAP